MTILLGMIIGLALGLTGGGGSIFAVPLLIYVLGMSLDTAVPISLITVSLASLFGLLLSLKSGLVAWRAGFVFALGGIVSAPFGTELGSQFSDHIREFSFAVLMLLVGWQMWRKALGSPEQTSAVRAALGGGNSTPVCSINQKQLRFTTPCAVVLSVAGAFVGILAGIFGVGGGFLIVPTLMTVTQIGAAAAVATSLLAISLISASGFISSLLNTGVDLTQYGVVSGQFVAGSLLGMMLGRIVAQRLAGPTLQKAFAAMVLCTAFLMLATAF